MVDIETENVADKAEIAAQADRADNGREHERKASDLQTAKQQWFINVEAALREVLPPQRLREMEAIFAEAKVLRDVGAEEQVLLGHQIRDFFEELDVREVEKLLKQLDELPEDTQASTREARKVSKEVILFKKELEEVKKEASERRVASGSVASAIKGSLEQQVFENFSRYLEEGAEVRVGGDQLEIHRTSEGKLVITVPSPSFENMVALAGGLGNLREKYQSNPLEYAEMLKTAALIMEQHAIYSPEAITALYNAGDKLEQIVNHAKSTGDKKTFAEIQEISRRTPGAGLKRRVDRVYLRIFLGEHEVSELVLEDGRLQIKKTEAQEKRGEARKLYDVLFDQWQKWLVNDFNENPEEKARRDTWLSDNHFTLTMLQDPSRRVEVMDAFDLWLCDPTRKANLLKRMKGFMERKVLPESKEARLVEEKKYGILFSRWQDIISHTKGGDELLKEAIKKKSGTIEERLREITALFQPEKAGSAKLLKYVPAEVKALLEGGQELGRTNAACTIASAYEKHVLEQMGFSVFADLSGAHSMLLVWDSSSNVFYRVDPNSALTEGSAITKVDEALQRQLIAGLSGKTSKEFDRAEVSIRVQDASGKVHVIGGDKLIASEFLSNLAALEGQLKKQLGEEVPQDMLNQLRFALAKKATDMAPDNYVAWAQMAKYTVDGRSKEYTDYANALNAQGVREVEENEMLVGLSMNRLTDLVPVESRAQLDDRLTIPNPATGVPEPNPRYNPEYKKTETDDVISWFENAVNGVDRENNINRALGRIESLVSSEVASDPGGHYEHIIKNLMVKVEAKIFSLESTIGGRAIPPATPGPLEQQVDAKQKEWQNLARFTLEFGLENIIGQADFNPRSDYPQTTQNLYVSGNIEAIFSTARIFDQDMGFAQGDLDQSIGLYIDRLKANRYGAHVIFKNIIDKKSFKEGVAGYVNQMGLQFLENRIAGVAQVQRLYEKVYADMVAKLGHIPSATDFADIADKALSSALETAAAVDSKTGFALRDWQKRRAKVVGMQLSGLSQRRQQYGVLGDMPDNVPDIVKGFEGEGSIGALIGGLKGAIARYFDDPNSLEMLQLIYERLHHQGPRGKQYGLIQVDDGIMQVNKGDSKNAKHGKIHYKGLYGQSEKLYAILDTGVQDPRSNPWIAEYLYLRQEGKFKTESFDTFDWNRFYANYQPKKGESKAEHIESVRQLHMGKKYAIGTFLDEVKRVAQDAVGANSFNEEAKAHFNQAIREMVKNQKLFLGSLIHYGYSATGESPLDDINKALIWDNVADLIPSRIASFLPEEARNILSQQLFGRNVHDNEGNSMLSQVEMQQLNTAWDNLKEKLWLAEDTRVKVEEILLRTDIADDKKRQLLGLAPGSPLPARALLNLGAMSANEQIVVRGIQDLGHRYVAQRADGTSLARNPDGTVAIAGDIPGGFARMTFIFTPFLDDAPSAQWENLDPSLIGRHLVGNQDLYEQSSDALVGLIAGLIKKPGDNLEMFAKVYSPISNTMGMEEAQKKMVNYVGAYAEMVHEKLGAKYFGAIMKALRVPRSKIEEGNLQANLAFGAQDESSFLEALAQLEIINDKSQYENNWKGRLQLIKDKLLFRQRFSALQQLKKDTEATRWAILMEILRVYIFIFGVTAGMDLFKAIFPTDLGK